MVKSRPMGPFCKDCGAAAKAWLCENISADELAKMIEAKDSEAVKEHRLAKRIASGEVDSPWAAERVTTGQEVGIKLYRPVALVFSSDWILKYKDASFRGRRLTCSQADGRHPGRPAQVVGVRGLQADRYRFDPTRSAMVQRRDVLHCAGHADRDEDGHGPFAQGPRQEHFPQNILRHVQGTNITIAKPRSVGQAAKVVRGRCGLDSTPE